MSTAQEMYHAHMQFGEEHPEWAQMALGVINAWGRAEKTLAHAVGEALMEAHRMGQEGESPSYTPPTAPKIVRRSRAPQEAVQTAPRLLRRSR